MSACVTHCNLWSQKPRSLAVPRRHGSLWPFNCQSLLVFNPGVKQTFGSNESWEIPAYPALLFFGAEKNIIYYCTTADQCWQYHLACLCCWAISGCTIKASNSTSKRLPTSGRDFLLKLSPTDSLDLTFSLLSSCGSFRQSLNLVCTAFWLKKLGLEFVEVLPSEVCGSRESSTSFVAVSTELWTTSRAQPVGLQCDPENGVSTATVCDRSFWIFWCFVLPTKSRDTKLHIELHVLHVRFRYP